MLTIDPILRSSFILLATSKIHFLYNFDINHFLKRMAQIRITPFSRKHVQIMVNFRPTCLTLFLPPKGWISPYNIDYIWDCKNCNFFACNPVNASWSSGYVIGNWIRVSRFESWKFQKSFFSNILIYCHLPMWLFSFSFFSFCFAFSDDYIVVS